MTSAPSNQQSKPILLSPIIGLVVGVIVIGTLLYGTHSFPLHFALDQAPGFLTTVVYFAFSFVALVAFVFVVMVLGDAVYRNCVGQREDEWNTIERSLIAFGIGTWLLCVVSVVLGMMGWLHEAPLRYSLLALTLIALLISTGNEYRVPSDCFSKIIPTRGWIRVIGILLLLFLVLQITICLLPTTDWDDAAYQTTLAKALLERGNLGVWEDAAPFNFPANAQMLYVYFTAFHCDVGIRLLNLMIVALTVVGAYAIGARVGGKLTGIIAACLLFSCNILWEVGTTSRVDTIVAFYSLLSIFFLTEFVRTHGRTAGILFLTFAGMSIGFKLTGLFLVGLPVIFFFWQARTWKLKWIATGLLVFLVPSAFWYLRNLFQLGAILYPIVISTQGVHRAEPTFDSQGKRNSIFETVDGYFGAKPEAVSLSNYTTKDMTANVLAYKETNEKEPRLYNLRLLLFQQGKLARKKRHYVNPMILLGLVFPWLWWREKAVRLSVSFSLVLILIVVAQLSLLRYLIPAFPFLALATAVVLSRLYEYGISHHRVDICRALQTLLAISIICPPVLVTQKWLAWKPLPYLCGQESKLEFISRVGYNDTHRTLASVIELLNDGTKPDEKVFLVGESKGYLLTISYRSDYEQLGRYANSWLKLLAKSNGDHQKVRELLNRDNFTHLVVNWDYFQWVLEHDRLEKRDRLRFALLDLLLFIDEYGELRFQDEDYWVVWLRP